MTSAYSIRAAKAEDQQAIKQLIRGASINPLGLHWSRFLVAVDQSENLIACGQAKPHGDGSIELASIAVIPAWQRRGVAAALIKTLQEQHGPPLWLTCMDKLIPFYEQHNFQAVTDPAAMPPYFRRVTRLFKLYQALTRTKGHLAVMLWPPP